MFGHDIRRSQVSTGSLDVGKLQVAWRWTSHQPPLPAWGQPAKGDAIANLKDFASMRNYDPAFHPISGGGRVYFGSNVDDSVRCLDLESGKLQWIFTTGGPVRIAPALANGKLYFGSDEGSA